MASAHPMPAHAGAPSRDPLLQPFRLKNVALRNRLISTAHEPAYTEGGLPKERYRLYHAEKARGGIGMTMIGGSSVVAPDSPQAFGNIELWRDEAVRWLRELADDVHSHGAAVMIQITHLGRRTSWATGEWLPILAPSSIREPAHRAYPKAMEDWDVERVVGSYADAAEKVAEAGLDGIELEAYGHLIDQFWSPLTNHRDDEHGGSLDNRMRFGNRVIAAVRERVGPDFALGIRMVCDEDLPGGIDREEGLGIAGRLAASGAIDFVNVIRGHIDTDEGLARVIPGMGARSAPHLDFSGEVRGHARLPVMHAARIQDVATARHAVEGGLLDLVGMTRAHIADPHIARKIARGEEGRIRPCVGAAYCIDSIYNGQAVCIHNASTGREARIPHVAEPAARRRRVVVVGGGPGGLEAARVAGERGHDVVVLEAQDRPGGQLRLAGALGRRREIMGVIEWRTAECERLGVEIRCNAFAEAEDVTALDPDLVVIATGGVPDMGFLEEGAELVTSSWDVLSGAAKPSGEVILYDDLGAHPGLTAAEFMAEGGARLAFVTPERVLGPEVGGTSYPPYLAAMGRHGVEVTLNLRLVSVRREGNRLAARFRDDYARRDVEREADHVVVENGAQPVDDLYFALKPLSSNLGEVDHAALLAGRPQAVARNPDGRFTLWRVGDAVASRNVHAAVLDAARLMKDA